MVFEAMINVPGYLPQADIPALFTEPRAAWAWLLDERRDSEDSAVEAGSDGDGYSATFNTLERLADGTEAAYADAGMDPSGVGVVVGATPGYDGDHDLGLVYSVTVYVSEAQQAFDALEPETKLNLLGRVFEILEYDDDGMPGSRWSPDTTQALGELFNKFGVVFTSPDEVSRGE